MAKTAKKKAKPKRKERAARGPISPTEFKPLPPELDALYPGAKGKDGKIIELYDGVEMQKRSLMHMQKTLCNGEATGKPCAHYWTLVQIASSASPTHLHSGERSRACVFQKDAEPLVFDDGREGMAVQCNRYEPDTSARFNAKTGLAEERVFNPDEETFKPLDPRHIKMLEAGEITSIEQYDALLEHERIHGVPVTPPPPAPPPQVVSIDDALSDDAPPEPTGEPT